ncbi:MAG TPA: hypothetical protein VE544_03935 [Nitrososphaeraceae archaeon]|nr:hypothetical protein [Nitrososphaeraceae archaeon]
MVTSWISNSISAGVSFCSGGASTMKTVRFSIMIGTCGLLGVSQSAGATSYWLLTVNVSEVPFGEDSI